MERHMRLSRAAVVLVTIALIAAIAAAVWFASPESPYVPSEDSGAALGTAAPAEDGTVAKGYQPSGTGISDISTARNNLSGNYFLTENITVTSLAHAGNDSDNTFTGTLDGNGKTIKINAATNTSSLPTDGSQGGLFAILGGTVKNCVIEVENFQAKWAGGSSWANAGIIAGAGNTNAKVKNVKIVLKYSPDSMTNGSDNAYASQYGEQSAKDSNMRLGGVFGNVIGDVTFEDVTVDNQTSGDYGFSAHGWRAGGSWTSHSNGFIHIGGFVGNMQDGSVTANRIKLAGNANAKITVWNESTSSYRYNKCFIGGIIGYADNGGLTINGLIITYPMANNFSVHNNNYDSACGIINGYADGGNQGTVTNAYCKEGIQDDYALSNGTSTTVNFFTTGTKDAEFTSSTTIAFDGMTMHGPDKASEIVTKISQGGTESDVFEALLATNPSQEGTSTWVEANIVNATSTQAINFDAGRATSSTYSVVTDSAGSLTSVDGTTYNGTKVYDGTTVKTPTLNVGGTTVNAWTADSTTADVGIKTFSYNADALSGYAAATYNGGTYLVKDGTIYSPGNINVGGASQTFTLGNAFSYTITPMPMNRVAVSVSETKFYEGEALLDEWLTVTSTDPSDIAGTAKWDEGQTLSTQVTEYKWTWTPNSSNYQSYSGTVELNVFEKQIVSIAVTKAPKTEYVAYDAFDPTGIEVTATYSDDTTAVLTDEYAFKIVGADGNEVEGGIDKLFVAYDEVTVYLLSGSEATTTITINVDYVRFVVEQKAYNKDITYGDSYQWNAADFYTWSDNTEVVETYMDFYEVGPDLTDDISGIATADAGTKFIGRVLGRAFYNGEEVPEEEYDNFIGINNPDEIATEVTLTIVPRKIEIKSSGIDSGAYSGEPVDLSTLFTAQGVNDDVIDLSFDITLNNETCNEVSGAGTYSVTARLAESETNYTADSETITYTVTKLAIPKPQDAEESIVYDGKEHDVTPTVPEYKVVDGTTKATDAGNYSFTIALADKANTEWEGGTSDDITVTWSIIPMTIAGTVSAPTDLTYDGNAKEATFTLSSGELFNGDAVTIEYSGNNIDVTEAGFTATAVLPSSGNYAWADDTAPSANFRITPKTVNVTATSGSREFNWNSCSEKELHALFTLSEAVDCKLLVNDEEAEIADGQVSAIYDAKDYKIAIVSADANYTLTGQTSTTFTITVKKVEKPIISDEREFTYNGGEQGFEIVENQAYEVVGTTKATDAYDGYIFTIGLVSPGNVAWSDDTTGDITVEWKINNATFKSVTIEFAEGALDNLFTSSAMPTPTTIIANPTPLPEGVEGKFEWVESSLSEDTHTYNWTYTVPNYNVFEGTQELTARAAVLESIALSGEYKTEYIAYDFFDVEDLVVTAHFSHGENQPGEDATLALGEYTLTTESGQYDENGVPQLFVADGYVTVTYQDKSVQIDIKVAPKQIDAPIAATGLVYDGTEKVGVIGGDGYTLSGVTTATDANDYSATAVLTDKDNTTWADGTIGDKTIEWSIAKMVVSGAIVAPESLVYDGSQKAVSFNGQLAGNDEFGIAYNGDRQNVTADGFTVTVSLPNDNNYEWADGVVTTAAYKIEPKRVYLGHGNYTWGMSYDGVGVAVADLGGNTGDGEADLVFAYEDETLETKLDIVFDYVAREANGLTELVNAGEYTITFRLADSIVNYVADAYTTTLEITPMRVEATLTAPNEVYTGNEKNAILTVKTQLVGEDKVTVTYNNVNRIDYTGEEIVATAQLPNDNYVWAEGTAPTASFTIQKATIESVTVTVSDAPDGGWTTAMMPEFTSVSVKPDVEGEVVWDNGALIAGVNAVQPWTFVPATNNYEPYHGSVTLTVSQATLTGVFVEVKPSAYVAFDAFDRSSIVVEALYGEDRKRVTGYTLTFSIGAEGRLFAGTGITVTVAYTDGEVTQSAEFTIDVAKRTVAKPVVDTTVFDATGETITLPIAESEYYKIYGNTAIEPGRYVATVELKDAVNTMWEDGSTDVVSIAWTISEPVTSGEVIASILAMEKVTWQNAEEFLDLEARYNALDESEQTAEATAKLATLEAQYDALRASALDDIKAAHEVTAKSLGKALAAAAAGLSAAAIALAIAKRRSI